AHAAPGRGARPRPRRPHQRAHRRRARHRARHRRAARVRHPRPRRGGQPRRAGRRRVGDRRSGPVSRLSAADRRALRDVRAALASWSGPGAGALAQLIRPIGEAIGVDRPFTYRVQVEGGRLRCAFAHGDLPASVAGEIEREMSRRPLNWTGYNPFCPEPLQRNRTLSVGPERVRRLGMYPTMRRYGLDGLHQMRALVCDGPTLLAWVGGFLDRRPTARQHALLDALVPALRRRLELDRRVETADLLSAALDHVLDQLAAAAFLVGPRARVEPANAAGWARLPRAGSSRLARLREAPPRRDPE